MRLVWPLTFLSAELNSWTLMLHLLRYSKFSVLVVKLGMSWSLGIRLDEGQRRDWTGTPRAGRACITFTEATSHHTGKKYLQRAKGSSELPLSNPLVYRGGSWGLATSPRQLVNTNAAPATSSPNFYTKELSGRHRCQRNASRALAFCCQNHQSQPLTLSVAQIMTLTFRASNVPVLFHNFVYELLLSGCDSLISLVTRVGMFFLVKY